MTEIYVIELNMSPENPNADTLVFQRGDFKRNPERYSPMGKIDVSDRQRYEFDPNITVGDVIEDISEPGNVVIIYGDGAVQRCLKGFDRYKGRGINVYSLDEIKSDFDVHKIVGDALSKLHLEDDDDQDWW